MDGLGINSLGIVIIISIFMGAVIHSYKQPIILENPLIPTYLIGLTAQGFHDS
jgi:phospholipid/cholesterol/gamma-HCH transport system permease protein